jgi:S-adenosylmethionine uptake transporter
VALFALMDAVMKELSLALGAYDAVFWRVLAGAGISGAFYLASRPRRPSGPALRLHALRAAVTTAMALAFFWGLARVPLAEGVALSFVGPLFVLGLAAVILKEAVGPKAVAGSLLGIAGVVVIVFTRPGGSAGGGDLWGAAAILGSAVLWAASMILMRRQALSAGPLEVAFYQNLLVSLCLASAAPWAAELPPVRFWGPVLLAAVLAFAALTLLAWAYSRAEAHRLAQLEYTALLWAAGLGWVLIREPLSASTSLGAGLILAGCVLAGRKGATASVTAEALVPGPPARSGQQPAANGRTPPAAPSPSG